MGNRSPECPYYSQTVKGGLHRCTAENPLHARRYSGGGDIYLCTFVRSGFFGGNDFSLQRECSDNPDSEAIEWRDDDYYENIDD